jgi:hypothetical protein
LWQLGRGDPARYGKPDKPLSAKRRAAHVEAATAAMTSAGGGAGRDGGLNWNLTPISLSFLVAVQTPIAVFMW